MDMRSLMDTEPRRGLRCDQSSDVSFDGSDGSDTLGTVAVDMDVVDVVDVFDESPIDSVEELRESENELAVPLREITGLAASSFSFCSAKNFALVFCVMDKPLSPVRSLSGFHSSFCESLQFAACTIPELAVSLSSVMFLFLLR